jgi:hypothetical protein
VRHLPAALKLLASKAGAAVAAASLAVGTVAAVQQVEPVALDTTTAGTELEVPAAPDEDTGPVEPELEEQEPAAEPLAEDREPDEDTDPGDDTERDDEGTEEPATSPFGEGPEEAARGGGSATSERVHRAQVEGADVRPGDPGFGPAVSASARSGGHGQRVAPAARGDQEARSRSGDHPGGRSERSQARGPERR